MLAKEVRSKGELIGCSPEGSLWKVKEEFYWCSWFSRFYSKCEAQRESHREALRISQGHGFELEQGKSVGPPNQ